MSRGATGVKGINLDGGYLVGMEVANENENILVVTEKGYGKKTPTSEYRLTNRGGKGVKTLNVTDKNGSLVTFKSVDSDKDIMIITDSGIVIRLDSDKISTMSRVTQGVRLINLKENSLVSSVALVDKENSEEIIDAAESIENSDSDNEESN